jgi:hypothetical protein
MEMEIGDHLVSSRTAYTHHGLYLGGDKVIHYSGFSEAFDKGSIEITSINDFKQGNSCTVKKHHSPIYDAKERVSRARGKLGEDSYNIVFNNCEHFVTWCFYGIKSSSQVNSVVAAAAVAANHIAKQKDLETVSTPVAQQAIAKFATQKAVSSVATSAIAKTALSSTAGTISGLATATAFTGATATTAVSAIAAGSVATAAAPIAIAVGVGIGVGYGVKKVFDWIFD